MQIFFISIFPNLIKNWFLEGIINQAQKKKVIELIYLNPRDESANNYRRVDDKTFGGGAGMVMQYEPLAKTAAKINQQGKAFNIYLSPQGEKFNQTWANELAKKEKIALWCGRYEGIDQRFIDEFIDLELSLGDFVISGGELAAAVVADGILRQVKGVLGDQNSALEDSFQNNGLLDYPHFTRPELVDNKAVPPILLSGNHKEIAKWRLKQALGRTFILRPDIFNSLELTQQQKMLVNEFLLEQDLEIFNDNHY